MLKFDFRKRFCICTTAWETHYENESFPDKTGKFEHRPWTCACDYPIH